MKTLLSLFPLLFLLSNTSHHQHHNKNDKYLDPNCHAEEWNKGFEEKDRDTVLFKKEIIAQLPVQEGDVIADIGAGTGSFEKELSQKVGPRGKVFAVDIAPAFIPFMKERFKKEGLTNVEVVKGELDHTTLKESSVDLILVVDTYHHFDHHIKMLKDFHKILKQDGHLVIVDFKRTPKARKWILDHVDKSMDDYIKEITSQRFKFLREEKIPFKESFQLTFRKN